MADWKQEALNILPPPAVSSDFSTGEMYNIDEVVEVVAKLLESHANCSPRRVSVERIEKIIRDNIYRISLQGLKSEIVAMHGFKESAQRISDEIYRDK